MIWRKGKKRGWEFLLHPIKLKKWWNQAQKSKAKKKIHRGDHKLLGWSILWCSYLPSFRCLPSSLAPLGFAWDSFSASPTCAVALHWALVCCGIKTIFILFAFWKIMLIMMMKYLPKRYIHFKWLYYVVPTSLRLFASFFFCMFSSGSAICCLFLLFIPGPMLTTADERLAMMMWTDSETFPRDFNLVVFIFDERDF